MIEVLSIAEASPRASFGSGPKPRAGWSRSSPIGEKQALLDQDNEAFFTTPHYDNTPIILVNLAAVDLDELRELISESWRLKAPARARRLRRRA